MTKEEAHTIMQWLLSDSLDWDAVDRARDEAWTSDLTGGIDYDRWVGLVNPAPREAFADSLDLIDYFE